jgi:DNA replication licensing factor MCM7
VHSKVPASGCGIHPSRLPTPSLIYCLSARPTSTLAAQTRGCKFVKYQELRVQELPEQVPVGAIPRSLLVVARGEATRECIPGDVVHVAGAAGVERTRLCCVKLRREPCLRNATGASACVPPPLVLAGIFLPTPYTGFQAIRAGLTADTYLEAQHVSTPL